MFQLNILRVKQSIKYENGHIQGKVQEIFDSVVIEVKLGGSPVH